MEYQKADATHFLTDEDPETGAVELLDCLPLSWAQDGSVTVVLFDDVGDSGRVCTVDGKKILSVAEVVSDILIRVVSDLTLLGRDPDGRSH